MKTEIIGIVFSRDRAMQLDGTLRSFFLHCIDPINIRITILYHASNVTYKKQYLQLIKDYSLRNVNFVEENHFRDDFLKLLKYFNRPWQFFWLCFSIIANLPCLKFFQKSLFNLRRREFVMFLVDDNIFVRSFSIKSMVDILAQNDKCIGFSMRLGGNINYCYPGRHSQGMYAYIALGDDFVRVDWTSSVGDFAYPLEVSSSIYRIQDILPFLMYSQFRNPNSLESSLNGKRRFFVEKQPWLLCFTKSVTFCSPINIVQDTVQNRVGLKEAYTASNLSQMFEDGLRIDVVKFKEFTPNSCHQEVDLPMKQIT